MRKNPLHDKEKSDLSGTTLNTLVKGLGDIKKVTIFIHLMMKKINLTLKRNPNFDEEKST